MTRNGYNSKVVQAWFAEVGIPKPVEEYRFHPERKWRFDFAWKHGHFPLALEVQGGIFAKIPGGHNRGLGLRKEHEKRNAAAALGWRIIYVETADLCTQETAELIRRCLGMKV